MSERLHVLIVEDNPADVDLMRNALPEMGPIRFHGESVPLLSEALARLATGGIDLIMTDLGLPDSQGLATFRKLRQAAPDLAIIVLTGNDDQEMAIAAVREGAQDFLVKGQISGNLLVRAVRYAIERKRAEEDINRKAKELQEKNEELARFTYSVSHDLKSPLVTVMTFLGYLEQDLRKQDQERMNKDMAYIRGAADKMSRLLDEVLELSRIGRKMNPPLESPLQAIVREAQDLVAGQIAERCVQVEVTQEPVLLYGDRPRLVAVFQNLLDNAVKFMGDQPSPRVVIGVESGAEDVIFFVRDNGKGIDPRHQPKLFGLFEKLDPGAPGTGIGLALVKRIVEVHGGRIWAESEGHGKGTCFKFTLGKKPSEQHKSSRRPWRI